MATLVNKSPLWLRVTRARLSAQYSNAHPQSRAKSHFQIFRGTADVILIKQAGSPDNKHGAKYVACLSLPAKYNIRRTVSPRLPSYMEPSPAQRSHTGCRPCFSTRSSISESMSSFKPLTGRSQTPPTRRPHADSSEGKVWYWKEILLLSGPLGKHQEAFKVVT